MTRIAGGMEVGSVNGMLGDKRDIETRMLGDGMDQCNGMGCCCCDSITSHSTPSR